MQIGFFQEIQLESVADLLQDMSLFYNGSNASARHTVRDNLLNNILGRDSGVRLVVAEEAGQVIGLASVALLYPAPKEQAQLFMKELYVISTQRKRGVGAALMRWLAQYAVEKNCLRFDWTVDADNESALDFYNRLGASQVRDKYYFRLSGAALAGLTKK